MTNTRSRPRRDGACGVHTGYRSRVPRDGCAVEMKRHCLIRPWPLPTGVLIKPAWFANRVHEPCGLGGFSEGSAPKSNVPGTLVCIMVPRRRRDDLRGEAGVSVHSGHLCIRAARQIHLPEYGIAAGTGGFGRRLPSPGTPKCSGEKGAAAPVVSEPAPFREEGQGLAGLNLGPAARTPVAQAHPVVVAFLTDTEAALVRRAPNSIAD